MVSRLSTNQRAGKLMEEGSKMAGPETTKTELERDRNLTLHEMFRVVGDQMTQRDIKVLKYLYNGIFPHTISEKVIDGYSFLLALEKMGKLDSSNFRHLLHALRIVTRHDLIQYVTLRRRKTGVIQGKRLGNIFIHPPKFLCPSVYLSLFGRVV